MAVGGTVSATSNNTAAAGGLAGNDILNLGGGANLFGGDSLTVETGGGATSTANNTADAAIAAGITAIV